MVKKQRGDVTIIFTLVLIILVLGGIFFAERSSMRKEIDTLQTSLDSANQNVEKLTGINADLIEQVKVQKELARVAQEEAKDHQKKEDHLETVVEKLSKKLPATQPRTPTDKVDAEQEQRSLDRISVLNETFCSLNPDHERCIQAKEPQKFHPTNPAISVNKPFCQENRNRHSTYLWQ